MEKLREFKCRVLISTDLVMMTYSTCTMSSHLRCLFKFVFSSVFSPGFCPGGGLPYETDGDARRLA